MYTNKEKIALDEFAKKFFGIKMQPYQKKIIELIEKGDKRSLRLNPTLVKIRPISSTKLHRRLLTSILEIDEIMKDGITRDEFGTITAILPKHRPMMIIDDPIAPHRSEIKKGAFIVNQSGAVSQINLEMTRESFLQEYQCDFKQNYEISHYDDLSAGIKSCIDLREFGIDRDKKSSKTYYVDCAVISIRNGIPAVSYYANMNDFASHPKFKDDNLVVCLHEQYRRSETK